MTRKERRHIRKKRINLATLTINARRVIIEDPFLYAFNKDSIRRDFYRHPGKYRKTYPYK